jgi:hypothetical protein
MTEVKTNKMFVEPRMDTKEHEFGKEINRRERRKRRKT